MSNNSFLSILISCGSNLLLYISTIFRCMHTSISSSVMLEAVTVAFGLNPYVITFKFRFSTNLTLISELSIKYSAFNNILSKFLLINSLFRTIILNFFIAVL